MAQPALQPLVFVPLLAVSPGGGDWLLQDRLSGQGSPGSAMKLDMSGLLSSGHSLCPSRGLRLINLRPHSDQELVCGTEAPTVLSAFSPLPDLFCCLSALVLIRLQGNWGAQHLPLTGCWSSSSSQEGSARCRRPPSMNPGAGLGALQGLTVPRGVWACTFGGWPSPQPSWSL